MRGTMPLIMLLAIPSIDSDGIAHGSADPLKFTVRNALRGKRVHDHPYYEVLAAAMRRDGINCVPIHVAPVWFMCREYQMFIDGEWQPIPLPACLNPLQPMLGNGGHRVKIARELRLPILRWTTDLWESGWGDEPR
jgi:hypothetical protein